MARLKLYVIASPEDQAYCDAFVGALRVAGADVWYDEQCAGPGVLRREMVHQLAERRVVVLVLSRAALVSSDVREQCAWARHRYGVQHERLMLSVVVPTATISRLTFLRAKGFHRVEGRVGKPLSAPAACEGVLRVLALWAAGQPLRSAITNRAEAFGDLMTIGQALLSQEMHAGAATFFGRAVERKPESADAWASLGQCYRVLNQPHQAFEACQRALDINSRRTDCWNNLAIALCAMRHPEEGLRASQQALALDASDAWSWNTCGLAFFDLRRYAEALDAFEHAVRLTPTLAFGWNNMGLALRALKRPDAALMAFEHALGLEPAYAPSWNGKGLALGDLERYDEALEAHRRALDLQQDNRDAWVNQGTTLSTLGHHDEAIASFERGKPWDDDHLDERDQLALTATLRALGREQEAEEAEERARALGG